MVDALEPFEERGLLGAGEEPLVRLLAALQAEAERGVKKVSSVVQGGAPALVTVSGGVIPARGRSA